MRFFTFILIFFYKTQCFGQSPQQVINSSGLFLTDNLYAFDISIGEPIITTIISTSDIFTQGFLQPEIKPTNQLNFLNTELTISAYPNPFSSYITIESDLLNLQFKIFDITGKMVFEQQEHRILNLEFLKNGLYTLFILNENNTILATEKICKIE